MSRLNGRKAIDILPWQTPGLLERVGLTAEQTAEAAWFVTAQGERLRAAAAINAALSAMHPFYRLATWLYRVPGVRQLEDWAYRWIAANRYRLPGSTAACAVDAHPREKS